MTPFGEGIARGWARLADAIAGSGARVADALARRRVPLGFAFGVLVWWLAAPTRESLVAGGAVATIGEAMRLWAAGHLNKSREVTTSGPYRWFAHPLYIGSSVMGAGLAIASASVWAFALIAAYLAASLTAAMRREEAFLRRTFGDRYDRYQEGDTAGRSYSVAQAVRNREYRAVVGLAIAVGLLALKAYLGASAVR